MMPKFATLVFVSCGLLASVCRADVSSLRYNRFGRPVTSTRLQRLEAAPTPYPAAGFRPDRQFSLPREQTQQVLPGQQQQSNNVNIFDAPNSADNDQEQQPRPNQLYGAPARFRQISSARQQLAPQQLYGAPERNYGAPAAAPAPQTPEPQAERLTALKSARLSENREDQEDEDDAASEIDVDTKMAADADADSKREDGEKKPVAGVQPNIAYYPAGAVSFVHPLSAYVQPTFTSANLLAKLQAPQAIPLPATAFAQPQIFASPYLQPQYAAFAAPAQLQAW